MKLKRTWVAFAFAAGAGAGSPVAAQEILTLEEALRRADRGAYANRIADGAADAEAAQQLAALRGVLPSVRVEAGWARTNDPIGAFGTSLRQRSITQADFDPARLNHPGVIANYTGALVVEQPLFNADAHLGRIAASRAASAADASAAWTRSKTRLDVIRAYYGAVLATDRVATLEAAQRAAAEHIRTAESLVRAEVATRSDALLARVKAGEVEAGLISARGDATIALRQLALLLGTPDADLAVPERLPDAAAVRDLLADTLTAAVERRADVTASRHGLDAARSAVARARSLYIPRLNAFARFDWNSALRPYAGEENWTAGVMAVWSPFAGASQIAEVRAATAREAAARAGAEAAEAQAHLEVEQSAVRRQVTLARLDIAERALSQSVEAHRIVGRKYGGGLATVVELLDAAATERQSGLALAAAVYDAIVTEAERRHVLGGDVAVLTRLERRYPRTEQ